MNNKLAGAAAAVTLAAGVVGGVLLGGDGTLPRAIYHSGRAGRVEADGGTSVLVDLPDGGTDHIQNGRFVRHMPVCTIAPPDGCLGPLDDGGTYRYMNAGRVCCPAVGTRGPRRHRDGGRE